MATVELAVVLPFLLFLFVIAVDFGRILYFSQILTDSARDGAFHSMYEAVFDDGTGHPVGDSTSVFYGLSGVRDPYGDYRAAALAEATNLSPQPVISRVLINKDSGDPSSFRYYEVTADWTFHTLTQYPGVPSSIPLRRTIRMRWVDPTEVPKSTP
jgi:Flp pilus assembly protein TadG